MLVSNSLVECSIANPTLTAYAVNPNATVGISCLQGMSGPPGAGLFQATVGPIAAGATGIVDTIPLSVGQSVRWYLSVVDGISNLCRTSDVSAILSFNGPSHVHYALNGDRIQYGVHVNYSVGTMKLQIENLHANPLNVSLVRIIIVEL